MNQVNAAVQKEAQQLNVVGKVSIVGLSLGSGLATAAMARAPKLYSRALLFPAFYGISVPTLDRKVQDCSMNRSQCVASFIDSLVDGISGSSQNQTNDPHFRELLKLAIKSFVPEGVPIEGGWAALQAAMRFALTMISDGVGTPRNAAFQNLTKGPSGWGSACEADRILRNRGGYCNFRIEHLLAVHAVGQQAVAAAMKGQVLADEVQFAPAERDGYTRNGLIGQAATGLSMAGKKVHVCMYRVAPECKGTPEIDSSNRCGVPHSCIAPEDNLAQGPLYWWPQMERDSVAFLSRGTPFSSDNALQQWDGNLSVCERLDLKSLPRDLVAEVPTLLQLGVKLAKGRALDDALQSVAMILSNVTGVPRWIIQPVLKSTIQQFQAPKNRRRALDDPADAAELAFLAPPDAAAKVIGLVNGSKLQLPEGIQLISATFKTWDGQVSVTNTPPASTPSESVLAGAAVAAIVIGVLALASVLVAAVFLARSRRNRNSDVALEVVL